MTLSEPSPAVLEMEDVFVASFHAPDRVTLRDVNWRVNSGEFWILSGPHGSGRTDFLLTAAGLLPPRAGRIRWFGQPPPQTESGRQALRRKIGFVFEQGHLFSDLTLAENLALPYEYHGLDRDAPAETRVKQMLEATHLSPWAQARPASLPVAWQRRALLARALMLQPRLLLLDCPLRGLDRHHAEWWHRTLRALHAGTFPAVPHPLTVILTTEDPPAWLVPNRGEAWLESGTFRVLATPETTRARSGPEATGENAR
jgi:ABC-type sulfate/molybdate transport systems ATPase subunit